MSRLRYNRVTLPYTETVHFRQESVYDEVGGVDWFLTKFDIRVQAIINSNYLSDIAPALLNDANQPLTDNAAAIMKLIRVDLMKPKQALSFKFNGFELLPESPAQQPFVDARNGPQPQSCEIIQFNNCTFMIVYHIIAHYWERNLFTTNTSPPTFVPQSSNPVLFNRWSERVDIDNCNYTTRTREGKFMIRSDNVQGKTADTFRSQMAVISVPEGFLRTSSTFVQSPDGLAIQYTIVDKEQFKMPPDGVFESDGETIESSTKGDAMKFVDVRVRLKGDKSRRQSGLVRLAMAICSNKLDLLGAPLIISQGDPRKKAIVEFCVVRTGMWENWAECQMRAMVPADNLRIAGVALMRKNSVITPITDQQPSTVVPAYLDRGSAGLLLQVAAYWDPNLNQKLGEGIITTDNPFTGTGQSKVVTVPGIRPGEGGTKVL